MYSVQEAVLSRSRQVINRMTGSWVTPPQARRIFFLIDFFNNSDAILNFEHIAMHFGLSGVIELFWNAIN